MISGLIQPSSQMFPTPVLSFKLPVTEEERLQGMLSHHLRSEGRDILEYFLKRPDLTSLKRTEVQSLRWAGSHNAHWLFSLNYDEKKACHLLRGCICPRYSWSLVLGLGLVWFFPIPSMTHARDRHLWSSPKSTSWGLILASLATETLSLRVKHLQLCLWCSFGPQRSLPHYL